MSGVDELVQRLREALDEAERVARSGRLGLATIDDQVTGLNIARWDPAAVLRQVAAHRRILERHSGNHMCPEPADPEWIVYEAGERVCKTWPCGDLRDLAEVYGIESNPSTEEETDG